MKYLNNHIHLLNFDLHLTIFQNKIQNLNKLPKNNIPTIRVVALFYMTINNRILFLCFNNFKLESENYYSKVFTYDA